jgi:hypothetical protein
MQLLITKSLKYYHSIRKKEFDPGFYMGYLKIIHEKMQQMRFFLFF